MAEELVATFSGPLNSFSVNLTLENASKSEVREFGISGRTAKFPVTWQTFGALAGPAHITSTAGLNTEVLIFGFSNFGPGVTIKFAGIDPDFTGDSSSGVRILDMSGTRVTVLYADGTTSFGEFKPTDDGMLRAVVGK